MHVGHDDHDRSITRGPEHALCNLRAAADKTNGKRNEPKLLLYTAQVVADLKQVSLAEVARATTANAVRLFRLPAEGLHHAQ